LVLVGCSSFSLSLVFPFCLPCDGVTKKKGDEKEQYLMREKLQSKAINPEILQHYQSQHLHCNPLLSEVLLVLLLIAEQGSAYVDYQSITYA
jgi:hypothetical protein